MLLSKLQLILAPICARSEETRSEISDNKCSAVVSGSNNKVSVQCADELASAQGTLDRVIRDRDGSSQGQVNAVELLVSQGYKFVGVNWSGINLSSVHLDGAILSHAKLHLVDMSDGHLKNVNLATSGLRFANLSNTSISDSNLSEVYAPFLRAPQLSVEGSDMSFSNLSGSILSSATFYHVNFKGASFAFADLRNSHFKDSDLSQANFEGAILSGVDFEGSHIENTAFDGAVTDNLKMSDEQLQGRCRVQQSSGPPTFRYNMSLLEEWPSNKYDTGFEFEKLIEDVDDVPYAVYSALRVCTKTKDAVGFDAQYPAEWGISIDRGIAEKAGRRGR